MSVRSGRYRNRILLKKPKLGENNKPLRNRFGELTGEMQVVQRPWCAILEVKSDEVNASNSITGQDMIMFELRYTKELENPDSTMIIEYRNIVYDIIGVVDLHLRREKMHVTAKRRR